MLYLKVELYYRLSEFRNPSRVRSACST
jgi:hypothetical protein